MALTAGARLGAYEILAPIGAGGMGEVYRARDTKLGRDVAIKILSEKLAPVPERLARFEREAHLLASLNHPNIATIHGLEKDRGIDFLVLELVEGETLGERIARGPIPLDEALRLFEQIAHGLEAAHEKGIIHRDLKPPNVKITPDGHVKILDFGLGKMFEAPEGAEVDLSQSPTLTREGTRAGVILGTAAYMSPEQARGDAVDKRTDIWAFGCCLYEALTGKPAFAGATVTDILASVMRAEPDWERLPETTPTSVRRLLRRSLNKERGERLQHIGDARLEIREGLFESELPVTESVGSRGDKRVRWIWTVVGAAVFSWALWTLVQGEVATTSGGPVRLTLSLDEPVTLVSPARVAVSPDGGEVVFVGSEAGASRLFARSLTDWNIEPLPGTDDAVDVFFSPDGEWVGFSTRDRSLKKIALNGGVPLVLCAGCVNAFHTRGWGPDGAIVFASSKNYGLVRLSADRGGTPELLVQPDVSQKQIEWYVAPQVLPRANAVLFTILSGGTTRVAARSADTGRVRTLVEPGRSPSYLPTGHLVSM